MKPSEISNLHLPDEWMAELPVPVKVNGITQPGWNAVPLFFNIQKATHQPADYRTTDDEAVRNFLHIDVPGRETMSEFMAEYWCQLSNGKFSLGIEYVKNADGTAQVLDLDFTRDEDDGGDLTVNHWVELAILHLESSAEKVWEAAGSLIAPNGRKWIPSVFIVNRNRGGAWAQFHRRTVDSDGQTYEIGDIHTIRYNWDFYKADGSFSDEADSREYWSTIAHEFAHNFGEQGDLYGPSGAIGYWDLFGDGCTYGKMSEISSLYKWAAGWLDFKEQIIGPSYSRRKLELRPYTTSHDAILVIPDPYFTPHEFFLLEYRKSTGTESWRPDGALTEEGLLIFHINLMFPSNHTPWSKIENPPFDTEIANFMDMGNSRRIYFDDVGGNLYPQPNNNAFTDFSRPNSKFYGQRSSGLSITNIRLSGGKVKFDLEINGYSQMGWHFKEGAQYVAGRFSPESLQQGEELFAWSTHNHAHIHEREGQFNTLYQHLYNVAGFPLSEMRRAMKGDFDGDGLDELFIRTTQHTGLLKVRHGRFELIQQYLALWTPQASDKEITVKLRTGSREQILLHRGNQLVLWRYTAGEMIGFPEVTDSLGGINISANLQILPLYLRNTDRQDLLLFDGDNFSIVAYEEASNSLQQVAFYADRIGSWNLGPNDKFVAADLDKDNLEEVYIRSGNWQGILDWNGAQLVCSYIKEDWILHKDGNEDNRMELKSSDEIRKGKFQPDGDGIYHITSNKIAILLWNPASMEMEVQRWVTHGEGHVNLQSDDQLIFGDFHRIGGTHYAPLLPDPVPDYMGDGLTDIFVVNGERAQLLAPNYAIPENGEVTEEFAVTWQREKGIPLEFPGSQVRAVRSVWEDSRGRNQTFVDFQTGAYFTRELFVNMIEEGLYPDYHIREINGVKTPVSNPNSASGDNLE